MPSPPAYVESLKQEVEELTEEIERLWRALCGDPEDGSVAKFTQLVQRRRKLREEIERATLGL